jgi:hypothetical protein
LPATLRGQFYTVERVIIVTERTTLEVGEDLAMGSILAYLRSTQGLNQKGAAARLDIHPLAYGKIERGISPIPLSVFLKSVGMFGNMADAPEIADLAERMKKIGGGV